MLTTVFKDSMEAKQVTSVGNMLIFNKHIPGEKLSSTKQECWKKYCKTLPETIEHIKRSISPQTLYSAAFHAVKNIEIKHHYTCLLTDPNHPKKMTREVIEQEYDFEIYEYKRENYSKPEAPDRIEREHPLITLADLERPEFLQSSQLVFDTDDTFPSALFRFKATVNSVEKIFYATFHYGYPTMDPEYLQ